MRTKIQDIEKRMELTLLEDYTLNNISLVAAYDTETKSISLTIFNLIDQPNEVSRVMPKTDWGFVTFFIDKMMSEKEAANIVGLYLKDIEEGSLWWEQDE